MNRPSLLRGQCPPRGCCRCSSRTPSSASLEAPDAEETAGDGPLRVGRGLDGPGRAVPPFGEGRGLSGGVVVVAGGRAGVGSGAADGVQGDLRSVGVSRTQQAPLCSVPLLGQATTPPRLLMKLPTAPQRPVRHDTAFSSVPRLCAGSGAARVFQTFPFHLSAMAPMAVVASAYSTAMHDVGVRHDTLSRRNPCLRGWGSTFQALPSQFSASPGTRLRPRRPRARPDTELRVARRCRLGRRG